MYVIYADGEVLYSPNLAKESYSVISPKLTTGLKKAGSLAFLLPPTNAMYDKLQKLKSVITVFRDEEEIFRGRVLHDEKDFYNRKNVYCEGELSFLLDSQQRPYSFRGAPADLFRQYLTNHNSRVDKEKQFEVGEITVTDPNDYIIRSNSDYSNTLAEMKAKLEDNLGGYLRPRYHDGIRYMDYVKEYGKVSTQVIQFGVNLLDIKEYISAEEVFTVLIPVGAEQSDSEGNSLGRLTIENVNAGKDYIEDEAAILLFGRIERVEKWDDVTIPENLLSKGKVFLQSGIEMAVTLTIKAVDLHLIDVDTECVSLGDYVRVVSLPHKMDKYFLCSKIVLDLAHPDKSEYTFGVTFKTMSEKQTNSVKAVKSSILSVQSVAQSAQTGAAQANSAVQKMENVILEIPTEYVKTETFEAYKEEVESKISAVYRFKGSVADYHNLPTSNQKIGDTYNLLDTGANYAWSEDGWDKLSETIDLSEYVTKEEYQALEERVKTLEGSNA